MSLVPALCLSCSRVMLIQFADAQGAPPTCKACGGDARIVPGCSYAEADREQFEELSDILAEAHITPMEAQRYAVEARRALWSGAYAQQLERLTVRVLGLLPLHLAVGKNESAQRRIMHKLQTIFEAVATVRGGSAEYPIVTTNVPAVQTGKR
jgi:hypothetical protein